MTSGNYKFYFELTAEPSLPILQPLLSQSGLKPLLQLFVASCLGLGSHFFQKCVDSSFLDFL
eukprot:m.85886 g.85886  ORF g.85886 m.85886 type:complete len:62 (-) comp8410_c0_seq1:1489-1674(-)